MDDAALLAKIAKLDRLASDKNPNPHERAEAQRKADAYRKRLKQPQPTPDAGARLQEEQFKQRWERSRWEHHQRYAGKAAQDRARAVDDIERSVINLNMLLHKLKPSAQIFAADLCAQYFSKDWLSEKQLKCVNDMINEAEG